MTNLSPQNDVAAIASSEIAVVPSYVAQSLTLIPCNTLEDFPAFLEDGDARSLLAAWTMPWHPVLLAATGRLPAWSRADSLPPLSDKWVFLPTASISKLPKNFAAECESATHCHVFRGGNRDEFLAACQAQLENVQLSAPLEFASDSRTVSADDFYALGYCWLQVQLMTRRLRYTSNIDEIYFTGRVVEAARMMVAGDGPATVAALHEAFDALAEERDHYFSTDPHLVDLTLLAPSTLGSTLATALDLARHSNATPTNFLIDCDLAAAIAQSPVPAAKLLKQLVDDETVGVAGGGIAHEFPVHHQTAASIRHIIAAAKSQTDIAIGHRCEVFARAAGPTPGDLADIVAKENYIGAIPIDFAAGEGWSSESKLNWNRAATPLDVLVSKPIDGSRSDSFLSLAVRLGQAIDGGEVATALIVHWPSAESDSYRDLRRAASWGLALGRFWKIDDFFRDGQRPYHHYRGRADDGAGQWLSVAVQTRTSNPLNSAAEKYRDLVTSESAQTISALADLVNPTATSSATCSMSPAAVPLGIAALDEHPPALTPSHSKIDHAGHEFCHRLTASPANTAAGQGCLVVNPYSTATRVALRMDLTPLVTDTVFGSSIGVDGLCDVTVDVPAHGFVTLKPATSPTRKRWFAISRRIATECILVNEFMQIEISPKSGGIKGVYSNGRSNRYSLRLIHVNDDAPADDRVTTMIARSTRVLRSDESLGVIETDGVLVNASSFAVADYTLRYSLSRGSRWLWVEAEIKPAASIVLGENPWKSYFAFRSAIATEAATILAPLRDKLHRTEGKRFDTPAGLLIDETTRQTLLFNDGRPAHRQYGDRYIDSLLLVRDEAPNLQRFAVGFDVPSPIDALRSLIAPPAVVACDIPASAASSGWLVHSSSPDVAICDLKTESTSPLMISFLAIATRSEPRKAKIRFCRNVVAAKQESNPIEHSGDAIELSLAGHEVVRIQVELAI